jgi:adenylylsulfate kinase
MTAFISPYQVDRDNARAMLDDGRFVEIFVECPVEICEERDPKGLYKKARTGEIKEFTGVSAPYEAPSTPELVVNTGSEVLEECARSVIAFLESKALILASG